MHGNPLQRCFMDGVFKINQHGYVCYYRVSTRKQAKRRAHWWDYQQRECFEFLIKHGANIVSCSRDVASGAEKERPGLSEAVRLCKKTGATLFATRVDRIARSTKIISGLIHYGIKIETVQTCEVSYEDVKFYASQVDAIYERFYKDKYESVFELMFPPIDICDKELRGVVGVDCLQQIKN